MWTKEIYQYSSNDELFERLKQTQLANTDTVLLLVHESSDRFILVGGGNSGKVDEQSLIEADAFLKVLNK